MSVMTGGRGYVCNYGWFALLYGRNQHNIIKINDSSNSKRSGGYQPVLWRLRCQERPQEKERVSASVVMYGCRNWTIKGWEPKNWCFRTVVLEETLKGSLDSEEIKPVNPKGSQVWIFIGRPDAEAEAPVLCPSDVKNQLTGKDPDAGKDWGQ